MANMITSTVTADRCQLLFPNVSYRDIKLKKKDLQEFQTSPVTVDEFAKKYGVPVPLVHSADLPKKPVLSRSGSAEYGTNGFVNAVAYAYYDHMPLVIRPDDVWIEILTQLAFYTEIHAEQLRDKLVSHQGSKEITITDTRWSSVTDISNDHRLADFIVQVCERISSSVKVPELKEWYTTTFSTSTPTDQAVKCLLLMASLKKFFSYGFSHGCGFPEITLSGTREDWVKIREQVGFLKSFGVDDLTHWADVMSYTLGHFVAAYDNTINVDFWQSAVVESSGYSSYDNSTIHGWLLAFAPFNKKGKLWLNPIDVITSTHKYTAERVTHDSLVSSVRTVNITFTGADEVEHKLEFVAGVYDQLTAKHRLAEVDADSVKTTTKDFQCSITSVWMLRSLVLG